MKKMAYKIYQQIKNLLNVIGYLFWWIVPFALFLLATFLPRVLWDISFSDYLGFLNILVWPISALIILFFFKKVVTFLFFSIDGFNFFGAKGEIKNVYDLITEKVTERFENEKREKERELEVVRLQEQIETSSGIANENRDTAREILSEWKKTIADNKKLTEENNQLREVLEKRSQAVASIPFTVGASELGTGDRLNDGQPLEPVSERTI